MDLKPDNFMMHEGRPKLIDIDSLVWGNEKLLGEESNARGGYPFWLYPPEYVFAANVDGWCAAQAQALLITRAKEQGLFVLIVKADLPYDAFPSLNPEHIRDVENFARLCTHETVWERRTFGHADDLFVRRFDSYGLALSLLIMWEFGFFSDEVFMTHIRPAVKRLIQWDPRKRATPREALSVILANNPEPAVSVGSSDAAPPNASNRRQTQSITRNQSHALRPQQRSSSGRRPSSSRSKNNANDGNAVFRTNPVYSPGSRVQSR